MIRIETLAAHHERAAFDCGEASLDIYLQRYARQNATLGLGTTYVALNSDTPARIAAYYTLSASRIERANLPASEKLPRYPLPSALIARLAVDKKYQGKGLGELLLMDALARVLRIADEMGLYAVDVVALHERARAFYHRYGFVALTSDSLHLYLTLKTIKQMQL